mmetsp:Transcript_47354/g.115571  ORF Transcript_47354/g.115571 Transcript_47354/m.115571 type:complete len:278 (-) Transcript_47354:635-1468(-)|eukprot:CAMPEP_0113445764 /NCGR_PEP_ID=MMETSP0014_2-20120614/3356_1 /TAXON_ID=2857 /ORGANISM="Nitzschia sp." /LENGTH=277 /DNA_ID=CAMNT_0000336829 /DNA_START=33 /DNA_END=866 /DNA_ORIENTATION=- /assembly_acc=CAM_ASM_000159
MSQKETETTTWCGICLEDIPLSSHFHSSCGCTETGCKSCLRKWIETEEKAGVDVPSCPFCRDSLQKDSGTVADLLGRSFKPRECNYSNPARSDNYATENDDDLTQQYLEASTRSCPACGSRISKTEDTCDLLECVCGYRFCYACGAPGAACSCDGPNHIFERNVNFQFRRVNGNTEEYNEYRDTTWALSKERSIYHILRRQKERREEFGRLENAFQKSNDVVVRRHFTRKKEAIQREITRDDDRLAKLAATRRLDLLTRMFEGVDSRRMFSSHPGTS